MAELQRSGESSSNRPTTTDGVDDDNSDDDFAASAGRVTAASVNDLETLLASHGVRSFFFVHWPYESII